MRHAKFLTSKNLTAEKQNSTNMRLNLGDEIHPRPRFRMSRLSLNKLSKRHKTLGNTKTISKKELEEEIRRINRALRNTTPYELCINSLSQQPDERSIELNKRIAEEVSFAELDDLFGVLLRLRGGSHRLEPEPEQIDRLLAEALRKTKS